MIARSVAVGVGAVILAAVTHAQVGATGGYGTPHSYVAAAVALGVGCASVFTGIAWAQRRRTVAVCLVLTIIVGEFYGFMATAERLIVARENAQAPLMLAAGEHSKARDRIKRAQSALAGVPTTSKRLEKAETNKADADKAVTEQSNTRGCRENCAKLLQAQVDAAALEVASARRELEKRKEAAESELDKAQTAHAGLKAPSSATPLADRLGIPAWIIDLVTSAAGSIAANGLACFLLIFGAHQSVPRVEIVEAVPAPARPTPQKRRASTGGAKEQAARFGVARLAPGDAGAELDAIRQEYRQWCVIEGVKPLPDNEIALALADLFERAGIDVTRNDNGKLIAVGLTIKSQVLLSRR